MAQVTTNLLMYFQAGPLPTGHSPSCFLRFDDELITAGRPCTHTGVSWGHASHVVCIIALHRIHRIEFLRPSVPMPAAPPGCTAAAGSIGRSIDWMDRAGPSDGQILLLAIHPSMWSSSDAPAIHPAWMPGEKRGEDPSNGPLTFKGFRCLVVGLVSQC
jgi:hypothetical protein